MLLSSNALGTVAVGVVEADAVPTGPAGEVSPAWDMGAHVKTSIYLIEIDAVVRPTLVLTGLRITDDGGYRKTDDGGLRSVSVAAAAVLETPRTFRFASEAWATRPGDTPASTPYEAKVVQALSIERQIPLSPLGSRRVLTQLGKVVLHNEDGGLDAFLEAYAIDGRTVRVLVVDRGAAYNTAEVIFTGTATGATLGQQSRVEIGLQDNTVRLDKAMQATLFAGTGALEGGEDAKGKPKPIGLGYVRNLSPPIVVISDQVLVFGDGVSRNVLAVRDNGVPLAFAGTLADVSTWTPVAGKWVQSRAQSAIRLGSTAFGQITLDIEGHVQGGLYWDTPVDLGLHVLIDRAGFTPGEIDVDGLHALGNERPWRVGLWTGLDPHSRAEVLDALFRSINAWWGPDSDGRITGGLVKAPSGTPGGTLNASNILRLTQLALPDDVSPAVSRWRADWDPNYTVQTSNTDGATAELKAYIEKPARVAVAPADGPDPAIADTSLLAIDLQVPVPTLLRESYQADWLVAEWLDLFDGTERLFLAEMADDRIRIGLGRVETIRFERFGLDSGKLCRVVGHRFDAQARRVAYRLLVTA